MASRIYRSPLRYPGGKGCIFDFMSHFLVENEIVGINYAEPFAGGAGLALRLLMEEFVGEVFINDLDPSVYAFWKVVLNDPGSICDWIDKVEVSVNNWNYYKDIQRNYWTADITELAKSTLFLNRTNVSGVIKGGVIGGKNQEGKYKMDARFNKRELIERIKEIEKFAHRIHVSNLDGRFFVSIMDGNRLDCLTYLDPPYYKKGSFLYMNSFNDSDHESILHLIKALKMYWIISYDNADFILNLFKEEPKVQYRLSQCTSNRIGDEIIVYDNRLTLNESLKYLSNPVVL